MKIKNKDNISISKSCIVVIEMNPDRENNVMRHIHVFNSDIEFGLFTVANPGIMHNPRTYITRGTFYCDPDNL